MVSVSGIPGIAACMGGEGGNYGYSRLEAPPVNEVLCSTLG